MSVSGPSGLSPGQIVELAIEKGVYRGRGLGRVAGRVVLVPRAYPGDRLRARVSEVHAGWAEAVPVELIQPTPLRREAPCRLADRCGGCSYQPLGYGEQLKLKESVLRESLRRGGVAYDGEVMVHPSPERGWRMRASLHFAAAQGELRLGLRQEGTRRVVDVDTCLQLSESMNEAARSLGRALQSQPEALPALRGLDLLEAPDRRALVAVVSTTLAPGRVPLLDPLVRQAQGLTGLGVEARDRQLRWLHGPDHVEATVLGLRLRAGVRSFFQANRFLLEPLVREVLDLVPRARGRVLDLYSGVGLFALPLAKRDDGEILAVESAASAVEDARWNARQAELDGVRVVQRDVRRALADLPREAGERIVLDPPRTGAGLEVVGLLAARRPSVVVYVSCDPPTLARDLAGFAAFGYKMNALRLLDLFPDTFHLEAVARLQPA